MKLKQLLTGVTAGLLLYVLAQGAALAAVPTDAPKDLKYVLGFYYGNGENILIRENQGRLELLYRLTTEDKCFKDANIFPLTKVHFDSYTMNEAGPMSNTETSVKFERDSDGYGITCRVGGHAYSRGFMGNTTGEKAKEFRIPEITPEKWQELRKQAGEATMPAALAQGIQAQLVEIKEAEGIKVNSIYGKADNFFGAPLYKDERLMLAAPAVEALQQVKQDLARFGYGLVVWDAYRPWSASKLANLALPEKSKDMLEDPEKKGSPHNTGRAVDVGLYDLKTGEALDMISGFDEPSFRQYSSYTGGTSKQRYLRNLLREVMEINGFSGIEMEWWHFEFDKKSEYAHLNIEP